MISFISFARSAHDWESELDGSGTMFNKRDITCAKQMMECCRVVVLCMWMTACIDMTLNGCMTGILTMSKMEGFILQETGSCYVMSYPTSPLSNDFHMKVAELSPQALYSRLILCSAKHQQHLLLGSSDLQICPLLASIWQTLRTLNKEDQGLSFFSASSSIDIYPYVAIL